MSRLTLAVILNISGKLGVYLSISSHFLTKRRAVLFLLAAVSLAGLFAFHPKISYATNPGFISFQGKVVNADGTNVTNGTYPFNFIMWDDPTAGTNRWQELSKSVVVTNGVFQTNLGSATALPDFNAYPNLYLAIQFNNDAQGYMTPRVQLTSVPYAINSDKLGGLTSASFGQLSATNAWTGTNAISITSATAFQIQNTGSAYTLFAADTSAAKIKIGASGKTAAYLYDFDSNILGIGPNAYVESSLAVSGSGYTETNKITTLGTNSTASTPLYVKGYSSSQVADLMQVAGYNGASQQIVLSVGANGDTLEKGIASSATAFQVQNTSSKGVLTADTSGGQVLLGTLNTGGVNGTLVFNSTNSTYAVTLETTASQAASYTLKLPTATPATGKCLQTSAGDATQLTFDNCGSGGSGVTTVGAFSGSSQTSGASIAGSTITFGPADTTNPGMVSTGSQTITGDKTIKSTTNSTTAFQIQNSAGSSILRISTVDANPVIDPGFETTPLATLWTAANSTAPTRVTTDAWGGGASGNLNNSSANTNEGFKNVLSSTLANGTYTISWYDQLISGAAFTDVIAQYAPDGSTFSSCTNINTQIVIIGGWTRHICQFTASSATSGNAIKIIQQAAATRSWDIDGVQIDSGNQVTPYGAGSLSFNSNIISPINFTNTQDSASAFQITDAGNNNLMNVDTSATNLNNMLSNPSFETGTTGWAGKGSATLKQVSAGTTAPYEGLNSMEITTTAAANDGAAYAVTLSTSTTYTINLYARLASGNPVSTVDIGRQDQTGTDIDSCTGNTINSSGWTRLSCTFTTGGTISSSNIYINQSDATVRKIYVDGITLETDANATTNYRNGTMSLAGSVINSQLILQNSSNSSNAFQVQNASGVQILNISTATTNNLILNPGFEVNTTGWSLRGSATALLRDTATANTYLGVASGKVTVTTAASGVDGIKYSLPSSPTTLMTSGVTYTLSFYAKINGAGTISTMAAGHADDGSTLSACSSITPAAATLVNTGWTRFTCASFAAGAQSNTPYIYLGFTATSGTVTVNIDAVQLEAASSASAYGTGSITLNGVITSPATFKNITNSTTAFQVQNSAGSTLFGVDTLNNKITLGTGAGAAATVFIAGVKTDAGDPACVLGAIYYSSVSATQNQFRACRTASPTSTTPTWYNLIAGVDTQDFTGNGTWTVPSGISVVMVTMCGGGGSGGGGIGAAAAAARPGGSGGGGGTYNQKFFSAVELGASKSVVVGAQVSGGGSGATGTAGNQSTFGGTLLTAYGGGRGNAGQTTTAASGGGGGGWAAVGGNGSTTTVTGGDGTAANIVGVSGQGAGATTGAIGKAAEYGGGGGGGSTITGAIGFAGGDSIFGGGAGGGGGGVNTSNTQSAGSNGGGVGTYASGAGGAGGAVATNGTAGSTPSAGSFGKCATGGGGAGGNSATTGNTGGAGGIPGGGGGGGAGGLTTGGTGGVGARGEVWVISW